MFGKAFVSAAVLCCSAGNCPLASVWGMEPCVLSELFDCQQWGAESYFLSDAEVSGLVVNPLPVLC